MSSRRLTRYYAAQPSDKDYNIKTLVSWARQNAVQEAILEAADNLDDGNYDSIAVMQRAMRVGEDLSENDEDDCSSPPGGGGWRASAFDTRLFAERTSNVSNRRIKDAQIMDRLGDCGCRRCRCTSPKMENEPSQSWRAQPLSS